MGCCLSETRDVCDTNLDRSTADVSSETRRPGNARSAIGITEFARLVDCPPEAVPDNCRGALESAELGFRELTSVETEETVKTVFETLGSPKLPVSGKHRQPNWAAAWSDVLLRFKERDCDPEALVPDYYQPLEIARFERRFVRPESARYELDFLNVFRLWLFQEFFGEAESVYEFGCGSGHNLAALAQVHPNKSLIGLDWAAPVQEIARLLRERRDWPINGRFFDLFDPDSEMGLESNSVAFTMGALEQIGTSFEPFLRFLLERKPALCVNVEPLIELYDERYLLDCLGAWYCRRRGYLSGYLARLRQLEKAGAVEIGAAWHRTSKGGNEYISVKLDDPSFAAPIYANLVEQQDKGFALIWSR